MVWKRRKTDKNYIRCFQMARQNVWKKIGACILIKPSADTHDWKLLSLIACLIWFSTSTILWIVETISEWYWLFAIWAWQHLSLVTCDYETKHQFTDKVTDPVFLHMLLTKTKSLHSFKSYIMSLTPKFNICIWPKLREQQPAMKCPFCTSSCSSRWKR